MNPETLSMTAPADAGARTDLAVKAPFEVPRTNLDDDRVFAHQSTVFAASVGMIGVCVTTIGIVRLVESTGSLETLCDELLVFDSMLFLASSLCSFVAIRRRTRHERVLLSDVVDYVFFAGLLMMVVICMLFAWTII